MHLSIEISNLCLFIYNNLIDLPQILIENLVGKTAGICLAWFKNS